VIIQLFSRLSRRRNLAAVYGPPSPFTDMITLFVASHPDDLVLEKEFARLVQYTEPRMDGPHQQWLKVWWPELMVNRGTFVPLPDDRRILLLQEQLRTFHDPKI
jgi:hypothetical protein